MKFVSTVVRVDRKAGVGKALREPLRARVVLGEALDVVVERVEHRRRDDTGLAERAAEQELEVPGLLHLLLGAGEDRAHRAAEPLREADLDGVGEPAVLGGRDAGGDGGVEQARAVEMDGEAELAGGGDRRFELLERPDPPAGAPVRLLEHDDARRLEPVAGGDGRAELVGSDPAGVALDAGGP